MDPCIPLEKSGPVQRSVDPCIPLLKFGLMQRSVDPCNLLVNDTCTVRLLYPKFTIDQPQIYHRLFVYHRKKICGMNHRLKNRQPQIYHRIFIYDRQKVCGKIYGKSIIGFGPMADLDTSG